MCGNGIRKQLVLVLLTVVAVISAAQIHSIEKRSGRCILPPYPKNGFYEVAGDPSAKPGDDPEYVYLNVSCNRGSGVVGNKVVICLQGEWSTTMPECVPVCHLPQHTSVKYSCNRVGSKGYVPCSEYEPLETSVEPECQPGYYSPGPLPLMRCNGGFWSYVARCTPECGTIPADATILPWYVYIYRKMEKMDSYSATCAGSIISETIILTAAHCFWNDVTKLRTSGYVVVPGRPQSFNLDWSEVMIRVRDVKVTPRFQGVQTNYQEDIALVMLSTALKYSTRLQPVCLDFDYSFKTKQLQEGNLGTVAVWIDTFTNGNTIQMQKVPYMPVHKCIESAPISFREFITSDKLCAGSKNGTFICRGNSGAGLAFPSEQRGVARYYLRGIISVSPVITMAEECAPSDFVAFTEVNSHEHFIKEYFH